MSNAVVENLKKVLADTYALYLKTQNYHWNVEGPHFHSLHELFEEQYTEMAEAIDEIAERIRFFGEKTPGTLGDFQNLTVIKDGDIHAEALAMVRDLAADQKVIKKTLHEALKAAQAAGDDVMTGFLADRMAVHSKTGWMLDSIGK